ncbi:MAG: efflux RND transporter permease subunit, partial [Elusimicrobiota bacterium]
PFIFVSDVSGQLFKQLALTVIFSLCASLLVAMFLVPRYASTQNKIIKVRFFNFEDKIARLSDNLGTFLEKFLAKKERNCMIIVLLFLLSVIILIFWPKEFMPKIDKRRFFMNVTMLPGIALEVTDRNVRRIEQVLAKDPQVKDIATSIGTDQADKTDMQVESLGPNQARIAVDLMKGLPTMDVVQRLRYKVDALNITQAEITYVTEESIFGGASAESAPIQIKIKGKNIEDIVRMQEKVKERISQVRGIYGVKSSYVAPSPEIKVKIDKDKAGLYSLSVRDISTTAFAAIKGFVATQFKEEGEKIDIKVQLREEDRKDFSQIEDILLYSRLGMEVPLRQVAKIEFSETPSEIKREDGERVITVFANIAGRSLNGILADVNEIVKELEAETDGADTRRTYGVQNVSEGSSAPVFGKVRLEISGESQNIKQSFKSLIFVILFSVIFVYMIMASQFESLYQPFIITLITPLTLIGITACLIITMTALNVIVLLGFIILAGIVVNDGIVLVSYINELRNEGKDLQTCVIEAARIRLRPILVTTLTTVIGLLPLAIGMGEGSELRSPMAVAVIGGLSVATFFNLAVIPSVYLIFEDMGNKFKQWRSRKTEIS